MKKIIILLMAVSVILTSCGKSAGLSNGGKRADNKTSVPSPSPSPSPKPQPQKIDNDDIKQSWKGYAYDHMFAIGLILSVIAVCSVSVVKTGRPFKLFKNWFEVLKEYLKNKFKPKNQSETSSGAGEPELKPPEDVGEEE
jgi:hypothetical protein